MPPSPTAPAKPWARRLEQFCLVLLGLILACVPLFFHTQTQDQFELPKLVLLRILSSLLIGSAVAYWALNPKFLWRRSPLDWPLLAYSLWLGVKTVHSVSPGVSWNGEYENFAGSLTQLNYSLLFWLTLQFVNTWERARALARLAVWAALATSLYALLQATQRDFITWASESFISDRFFGTLGNPNFLAALACMAIVLKLGLAWEEQQQPVQGRDATGWGRALLVLLTLLVYLFMNKLDRLFFMGARTGQNSTALFMVLFWLAAIVGAWVLRKTGFPRLAQALGHGTDLLVLFTALANTGTRAGFLGLMAGLAVMALGWLHWRAQDLSWRNLLPRFALGLGTTILILGIALMGLGSSFRNRVSETLRNPAHALEASRLQIWVPAYKIWKANPWTGTGVDTFKSVFPSYSTSRFSRYDGDNVSSRMAHCEPLQILATMGVIGLIFWTLFCGLIFFAWWRRLTRAGNPPFLLLGLGAFLAAYLAQNLVSFGVVGISMPFFMVAALLFAGDPQALSGTRTARGPIPAITLGLVLASLGIWWSTRTWVADTDYALSYQINRQLQSTETYSAQEAGGIAAYGVQELQAQGAALPADYRAELERWLPELYAASRQLQENPALAAKLRPVLLQGGSALLYALSAFKMEQATHLRPSEVKYRVYLGLAYEETFKRTVPERREIWFNKARQAYEKSILQNPQNAYYHGNLGRLLGMAAEGGGPDYVQLATANYLAAIHIAPVTRLFYENLLLLYARFAKLKEAGLLMNMLEGRDKELAPGILVAAASTFYQWRQSNGPGWTPETKRDSLPLILNWTRRAAALAPKTYFDARDRAAFGGYEFTLAVFEMASGHKAEAKAAVARALVLKPGDPEILKYKLQYKL